MALTREQRLVDPDMNGNPITVGLLMFTATRDCWNEPQWRAGGIGGYVVSKHSDGVWWYRQDLEGPGFHGTTQSREAAMRACADAHIPIDRLWRWDQYMREHEPPNGGDHELGGR